MKKIRDFGVNIGNIEIGERNQISDVDGVMVGHTTIDNADIQTGVTAILPHTGNIFKKKLRAASHVINGFGKSAGLIQIDELGQIESPIFLTNTLSVGAVLDAGVSYMLDENPEICDSTPSVNVVVGECNDMILNNIRVQSITKEHVYTAINNSSVNFEQGAYGAGRGMKCYGLKGGIGSSSRVIEIDSEFYTLGTLVLANFGRMKELTIDGRKIGLEIYKKLKQTNDNGNEREKGSIVVIMATDAPLSHNQIRRVASRASVGIVRTGSFLENGSGDICIGFSTYHKIPHDKRNIKPYRHEEIHDDDIDLFFRAMGESTEESILNALCSSQSLKGYKATLYSLSEFL